MTNALEKLNLIVLPSLLQNPLCLLPLLSRKSMIVFCAREQQWFGKIMELLISKRARMRKCSSRNEAFCSQRVEYVRGAEAVPNATIFGGSFAVSFRNGSCPLWNRRSCETGMLVSPCCMLESRICDRVIFVFPVFPNWILHLIRFMRSGPSCQILLHL
jgi:hypothetical protein